MNKKIIIGITITTIVILATIVLAQTNTNKQVYLQMSSNKDLFILGEPIQLTGEYINNTNQDILVTSMKTTSIYVAKESEDYKWYDAAPTDCSVSMSFPLKATNNTYVTPYDPYIKRSGVFLLNAAGKKTPLPLIDCGNLKGVDRVDCLVKRNKPVETEWVYAFQDVGTYYAKYNAYLVTDKDKGKQKSELVTVEPVKITIVEPTGDDLEVWKIIGGENKFKFASMMREGNLYDENRKDEAKTVNFINQVEQILIDYPNSTYSTYLREGLNNYRARESEKVRAAEKAKEKAKP